MLQNTMPPAMPGDPMLSAAVDNCRAEIDRIDDMILAALDERARVVQRLAVIKRHQGVAAFDPARENSVLDRVSAQANTLPAERRRAIFAAIIAHMRDWQGTLA